MSRLLICLFTFVLLLAAPAVRADDVAEAKAAFHTLQEYQKTDDERSIDMFATDVEVTLLLDDGANIKSSYLPRADFFRMFKKELAKKEGLHDEYEDVKFSVEGAGVRMKCTIIDGKSGQKGPFTLLYGRNSDGALKIKEMKVTVHVPPPQPAQPGAF